MGYTPRIIVVGGGAIGTGIARDLAMRGLEVTLLERGSLTAGATGRARWILYSGARFADSSPELARRCRDENDRLRTIAGHCIQATGGLHVPVSGQGVTDRQTAAESVGVDCERLDGGEIQRLEPRLSSAVESGLFVPDGTVDPFALTVANARSATEYACQIRTGTEVLDVNLEDGAVSGVEITAGSGTETVEADYVVNAAGPWVDRVAAMADLSVPVDYRQGTTVVVNERPTEAVIERWGSGVDATLTPVAGRCLVGGAVRPVESLDCSPATSRTVDDLLESGAEVVPGLAETRSICCSTGVWPFVRASDATVDGHAPARIVDHERRDDTWGLSSVVGGTLTTSRLVAQEVADHVCEKFGIRRDCPTIDRPLPGSERPSLDQVADTEIDPTGLARTRRRLGGRTREVLETDGPNPVVCACESVTRAEVRDAIADGSGVATDLDDVAVRTRATTGECQGGRCLHRVASELYPGVDRPTVDAALEALSQERFEGQRTVLWGDQLAEMMATYTLHATTMNRDRDDEEFDLDAFDSGPEWDDRREGP